jgi:hypothetical protein
MAIVYPLANGNWSTVANWYSGGVAYGQLPQVGDDVYLNGKALNLNVDNVVINSINSYATTGILQNGTLDINTNKTFTAYTISGYQTAYNIASTGVTINIISTTINGAGINSLPLINITGTSGTVNFTVGTIIGLGYPSAGNSAITHNGTSIVNITGNITAPASGAVINNGTGILNVNGNITTGSVQTYAPLIQNNALGTTNFTGSIIGGTLATNGWGINNAIGTVNILSNQTMTGTTGIGVYSNAGTTNFGTVLNPITITGAPSTAASGLYACYLAGGGIVTLYGNIVQSSYSSSVSIGLFRYGSTSGTMTINGNITAGTVANTIGLNIENTGTVIVNGNVTGGSNATNTPAVSMSQAGTININGTTTSNSFPAISSSVTTAKFNLLGDVVNTAGVVAYYGSFNVKCSPTVGQSITYRSSTGTDRILATTNVSNGAPTINNVRYGIVYGSTNELTGTLRMAIPSDVRVSVPTDNTVGTATITAQDFWDYAVSNLTTTDSIGKRLKNCSTVQTTGDQIAAF